MEIWRWRVNDPFTEERVITPYRMLALIDDPTAGLIEGTGVVRVLGGAHPQASVETARAALGRGPGGTSDPGDGD